MTCVCMLSQLCALFKFQSRPHFHRNSKPLALAAPVWGNSSTKFVVTRCSPFLNSQHCGILIPRKNVTTI